MASFRCLPHGKYGLFVTILTTCGWIAGLLDDSCNYSVVEGGNLISMIAGINDTSSKAVNVANFKKTAKLSKKAIPPYIEVGFRAYRVPTFNKVSGEWETNYDKYCTSYDEIMYDDITADRKWQVAMVLSFIALLLGGIATFYMWSTTMCVTSSVWWRRFGFLLLLTSVLQMLCLLSWFRTNLCNYEPDVKTDDVFSALVTPSCKLSTGSKGDISATCLWFVAGLLLCVYYPKPPSFDKPTEEKSSDGIEKGDDTEDNSTVSSPTDEKSSDGIEQSSGKDDNSMDSSPAGEKSSDGVDQGNDKGDNSIVSNAADDIEQGNDKDENVDVSSPAKNDDIAQGNDKDANSTVGSPSVT